MIEFVFIVLSAVLGVAGGAALLYLRRGGTRGRFGRMHWATLVAAVASGMLYANLVLGWAVRHLSINDIVVGAGGAILLAAFLGTVLVSERRGPSESQRP